jgi:hypothetical protein
MSKTPPIMQNCCMLSVDYDKFKYLGCGWTMRMWKSCILK